MKHGEMAMIEEAKKLNPKQPPLLFDDTQKIITSLEKITGMRIISYWTSGRGSVCANDVVALYEMFEKIGYSEKIGIFIKSGGGDVESALRIVNLIREYSKKVVAYIPLECASAATMISLGADEIQMGPLAHLTAVDSSLRHDLSPLDEIRNHRVSVSQDELSRLVKLWEANAKSHHDNPYSEIFKYIHPLVIGAIDRSSSLSIKVCREILSYHLTDAEECERISQHLNSDFPSHSYPITAKEAKRIGLNVSPLSKELNNLLLDLNGVYSEMAQKSLTDYDEYNYHDNEILNIIESEGVQIYYQNDKDWNYIKEERRWQTLNDESSWRKTETKDGEQKKSVLHIR
jgi:Clp protease